VIGTGPDAREWPASPRPAFQASASHCNESDTVDALSDGRLPQKSSDGDIPRFTWWDHRGTVEWVQYDFDKPRKVSAIEVYWFDDTGRGQCRVPKSWKLLHRAGDAWKPVESATGFGTKPDGWNRVAFPSLQTTALRIEVQLQPEFSGGILEWRVSE